ncbi:NUDIX domain-containing protein [Candidatus Saccharibacteria bacterium]|nr:MAG: NUDIX domain-containing protein [Candidatus Saccharibacteria bacterium]
MPHINTGPGEHDLTASAFIIRTDTPEPTAMVHQHKLLPLKLQFGGHVEKTESPWQAIGHELSEETGYTLEELMILQPHDRIRSTATTTILPYPVMMQTHQFGYIDHYHNDVDYAFVATAPPTQTPGDGESTDFVLLTATEIEGLDDTQMPENVRLAFLFIMEVCLEKWEHVPADTLA